MPTLTDQNVDEFYRALADGELVLERDLVRDFPAIPSACPWDSYSVLVYHIAFEEGRWYVALEEGCEYSADPNSCLAFCASLEEALKVVNVIVEAWCRKWSCGC